MLQSQDSLIQAVKLLPTAAYLKIRSSATLPEPTEMQSESRVHIFQMSQSTNTKCFLFLFQLAKIPRNTSEK